MVMERAVVVAAVRVVRRAEAVVAVAVEGIDAIGFCCRSR